METNKNATQLPRLLFGSKGFWHQNKPSGYEHLTGRAKELWDEFINSTEKPEDLKPLSSTGSGAFKVFETK